MLHLPVGAIPAVLHGSDPQRFTQAERRPEERHLPPAEPRAAPPIPAELERRRAVPDAREQEHLHHRARGEHTPVLHTSVNESVTRSDIQCSFTVNNDANFIKYETIIL